MEAWDNIGASTGNPLIGMDLSLRVVVYLALLRSKFLGQQLFVPVLLGCIAHEFFLNQF